jgi:hypothetical protein
MESGIGVDLQKRGASRHRLLLTGQAIVPVLIILTTTVSCSRRAAEMPEPPYRIVERILPFSSSSSDEENRQLVQRRSDARPTLQQDQHRASPPPKVAKVHCAGYEQRIRSAPCFWKDEPATASRSRKSAAVPTIPRMGGSARRTCRKEPTLTSMLFGKASDKTCRRLWVLCHAASATTIWSFPARPLFDVPQASTK